MTVPLLTAQEVADLLKVGQRTVFGWAQQGRLPCVRLGDRCVRFDPRDIEALIERNRERGRSA